MIGRIQSITLQPSSKSASAALLCFGLRPSCSWFLVKPGVRFMPSPLTVCLLPDNESPIQAEKKHPECAHRCATATPQIDQRRGRLQEGRPGQPTPCSSWARGRSLYSCNGCCTGKAICTCCDKGQRLQIAHQQPSSSKQHHEYPSIKIFQLSKFKVCCKTTLQLEPRRLQSQSRDQGT